MMSLSSNTGLFRSGLGWGRTCRCRRGWSRIGWSRLNFFSAGLHDIGHSFSDFVAFSFDFFFGNRAFWFASHEGECCCCEGDGEDVCFHSMI